MSPGLHTGFKIGCWCLSYLIFTSFSSSSPQHLKWFRFPALWACPLSHVCGISTGVDFLSSPTKLLQCDVDHVFEGHSRKMNLLFDTPLPLCYCEIRMAPVSVLSDRGACVSACVCVCSYLCVHGIFYWQQSSPSYQMQRITSSKKTDSHWPPQCKSCRLISVLLLVCKQTNRKKKNPDIWSPETANIATAAK